MKILKPLKFLLSKALNYLGYNYKLYFYSQLYKKDLKKIALLFGTDKEGVHHYAQHYEHHFMKLRKQRLNILEIGVGGYDNPKAGGESLRMWKTFFPKSKIFGIDIYDKTLINEKRIKIFKGNQADEQFLKKVITNIGTVDIIIDDGSHYNNDVITSFKILFPLLNINGIYVIEDLQTSYWENIAGNDWGGSHDLNAQHTSMNYLKSLTDCLNSVEFNKNNYERTYLDKHIISMHFYHNIVFIYKGLNNEKSNLIK